MTWQHTLCNVIPIQTLLYICITGSRKAGKSNEGLLPIAFATSAAYVFCPSGASSAPYVYAGNAAAYIAETFVRYRAQFIRPFLQRNRFAALPAEEDAFVADLHAGNIRDVNHALIHADAADLPGASSSDQHVGLI